MERNKITAEDATRKWVEELNLIPQTILNKSLMTEVTPLSLHDYVEVIQGDYYGCHGSIVEVIKDGSSEMITDFRVEFDGGHGAMAMSYQSLAHHYYYEFPIWGTMWTFGNSSDENWLANGGLQKMADCGFRIFRFEEDDLYIFGIDGAGYDFYEKHWVPLYLKRGLEWHDDLEKTA